jgi:hypothetical protein
MTLIEKRDRANAWISANHPKLLQAQLARIQAGEEPFQALITHSTIPADAEADGDNLDTSPTRYDGYTTRDFLTDAGVVLPRAAAIKIDVTEGSGACSDRYGQVTTYMVAHNNEVYYRQIADGLNPKWRRANTSNWAKMPEPEP